MKAQVAAYCAVLNDIVYAFSSFLRPFVSAKALRSATVLNERKVKWEEAPDRCPPSPLLMCSLSVLVILASAFLRFDSRTRGLEEIRFSRFVLERVSNLVNCSIELFFSFSTTEHYR